LKKNPEVIINKWELALERRGLALVSESRYLVEMTSSKGVEERRPTWIFDVSTHSTLTCDAVQSDIIIGNYISYF